MAPGPPSRPRPPVTLLWRILHRERQPWCAAAPRPIPCAPMGRAPLLPLVALALALLPACTYIEGNPRVLVTSNPAGAEILVDGQDTGKTTPAIAACVKPPPLKE